MTETPTDSTPDLSPQQVVSFAQRFFLKHWSKVKEQDVQITRIKSGWVNRVFIVERPESENDCEPRKLLMKMYGGNMMTCQPGDGRRSQELLVSFEFAKTKLSPKLYGVFQEGRVEEYIDSRNIRPNDCLENPRHAKDLAKCFAYFHSLEMPFEKQPSDVIGRLTKMLQEFREKYETGFRCHSGIMSKGNNNGIASYNFEEDLIWLRELMDPQHHRIVFVHWDAHLENILLRNNPKPEESSVLLVDFQESCYHYRGKDLGTHLATVMAEFSSDNPSDVVHEFPPESYYNTLFAEYLDNVERLGFVKDFDRNGFDSPKHLLFESLINGMTTMLIYLLDHMNHYKEYSERAPQFDVCLGLNFQCLLNCKHKFISVFGK